MRPIEFIMPGINLNILLSQVMIFVAINLLSTDKNIYLYNNKIELRGRWKLAFYFEWWEHRTANWTVWRVESDTGGDRQQKKQNSHQVEGLVSCSLSELLPDSWEVPAPTLSVWASN